MSDQDVTYEPPAVVEVGDFTALTNGLNIPGPWPDWAWNYLNLCPDGC